MPVATAPPSASTATVRRATRADGAALCTLFAATAMRADLALSVRRDPDFFALYDLQSDDWECWVAELDGAVEGVATVLVRDGYVVGERRRVGYLGDLRLSPRAEGRLLLDRFYGPVLRAVADRTGCELFLTAVIASNDRALRALTVRTARAARAGRPTYVPLADFDIRSVQLVLPPRFAPARWLRRSVRHVRRATAADVPALARVLDADARRHPFGYVLDEPALRRRFATWPGLAPESFYLAEDAAGAIAGCLALWDAAPVKRMAPMAYRGAMRRARAGYGLLARVVGAPPLPRPGEPFRYAYATHVAVPSDDPAVLAALLDAACAAARRARYHFVSVFAPRGDALDAAYRGLLTTDLPARLYVVAAPGAAVPEACLTGTHPGFEMALV